MLLGWWGEKHLFVCSTHKHIWHIVLMVFLQPCSSTLTRSSTRINTTIGRRSFFSSPIPRRTKFTAINFVWVHREQLRILTYPSNDNTRKKKYCVTNIPSYVHSFVRWSFWLVRSWVLMTEQKQNDSKRQQYSPNKSSGCLPTRPRRVSSTLLTVQKTAVTGKKQSFCTSPTIKARKRREQREFTEEIKKINKHFGEKIDN